MDYYLTGLLVKRHCSVALNFMVRANKRMGQQVASGGNRNYPLTAATLKLALFISTASRFITKNALDMSQFLDTEI